VQSFAIMGAAVAQHSEYAVNLEQTRQLADFLASTQTAQGYISAGRGGEAGITTQTALAGIGLGFILIPQVLWSLLIWKMTSKT
jgi:hypothetical protein